MRQLRDRDDLRVAVDAGYEGVLGQLTHAGREGQEVLRRELLVAEEHDLVLEPGPTDGRHGVVIEVGQVDPTDDGAERARDRRDGELDARGGLIADGHDSHTQLTGAALVLVSRNPITPASPPSRPMPAYLSPPKRAPGA